LRAVAARIAHRRRRTLQCQQSQESGLKFGLRFSGGSRPFALHWIVDAHRGDRKHFVVRADEKVTALVELEAAFRAGAN